MNGPRKGSEPLEFEIPDLDLPPPNPHRSQAKLAAVRPEAGEPAPRATEQAPSLFSELPGGPSLDLDLGAPISSATDPSTRAHEVSGRRGFELDSQLPEVAGLTVAPAGRANWPSGVTPSREQLEFDWNEVKRVANYGEPSSVSPLNAFYALRVASQRSRLKRELTRYESELAIAESTRDDRLAELALTVRAQIETSETFRRLLEPLADIETTGREQGHVLRANTDEQNAELRRLDAEIAVVQSALDQDQQALTELGAIMTQREQVLQRLDARTKRGFIELRAIEQRGGSAAESDKVRALQQQLEPELEKATAALQATHAEQEARAARVRDARYRVGEIERKKRDVKARFQKQFDASGGERKETESRRKRLLADVGRAVLAARGGVEVSRDWLEALRGADAQVSKALYASELRMRALDACERDKVSTGNAWIFGVLSALVAALCYRFLK